jgi:hypothetical protein
MVQSFFKIVKLPYAYDDFIMVQAKDYGSLFNPSANLNCKQIIPVFGSGETQSIKRELEDGWLPIPTSTVVEKKVSYSCRSFVAPIDTLPVADKLSGLRDRTLFVAEYMMRNDTNTELDAAIKFDLFLNLGKKAKAKFEKIDDNYIVIEEENIVAVFNVTHLKNITNTNSNERLDFSGKVSQNSTEKILVFIPAWKMTRAEYPMLIKENDLLGKTKSYWNEILNKTSRVELPNKTITNLIKASVVHCMLAARNEENGKRVVPCVGADRYGALDGESQLIIRGMDMFNCHEFARSGLEFFLARYDPRGYLATGYSMQGTGTCFNSIAEHVSLNPDLG